MSGTSTTESSSDPRPAAESVADRVFDTGSEHENLRQAAAELRERRAANGSDDPASTDRTGKTFVAELVGEHDAERLFGLGEHVQRGREETWSAAAPVVSASLLDRPEISRGELRSVARAVSDNRARANFDRVMAALAERAQANQQSIADILGTEQGGAEQASADVPSAATAEQSASTAPQPAPQNPQSSPDPGAQEHARLVAARQHYETAIPQMAAMLLHEVTEEMAQFHARGVHTMEQLAKADPAAYARLNAKTQKFAVLDQQAQAIERRTAQDQAQQWSAFAADQDRTFIAQNPAMADPGKRDAAHRELVAALREMGITDQEYATAFDSNRVLRDARVQTLLMKLSQAYSAQKRATEALRDRRANPVPPVQRPGVSGPRPDYVQQRRAKLSEQLDQASGQKALKIAAEIRALGRGGRRGGTPFV